MATLAIKARACGAVAVLAACGQARANVLVNPGFESGSLTPWTGVPNATAGSTVLQSGVVHAGSMAAEFTSTGNVSGSTILFQSFAVLPQVTAFSFWYRFDAVAAATMRLDLTLEGPGGQFFPLAAGPADTWVQYVAGGPILAAPNRNAVRLYALTTSGGPMPANAHIWIDDVEIVGVPSPGTAASAMLAYGFATARRRRVAASPAH